MTLTKTIFWSLSRQTVFLQNLLNHIRLLFCGIFDTSNNFFSKEFYLCMFAQYLLDFSKQKDRFAQVLAFPKVAKIEGKVFVALRAFQGDLEPLRATISPQSPCSLTPGSGVAKVSCILCHRGVQLILAYSWARLAILVAGKGRGGMFLLLLFLHFHSCSSFFPSLFFISSTISSIFFLPFSGRQHKMTHKG